MLRRLQLNAEYYEKTYPPYPAARNGCGERNSGPHVSGRRPRRGRAGTGRGVCDGGTAQGRRAGGRHGDRRRRTFRAEGPDGRIHPLDPVSGFRSRPAAGARRCGQRSGRHRAEKLLDADRGRGGQGAADPPARPTALSSMWPTPRRRSARMASNCWSALRAYGWTTRRSRSTARAVRRCTSTTASCAWNRRSC